MLVAAAAGLSVARGLTNLPRPAARGYLGALDMIQWNRQAVTRDEHT